LRPWDATSEMRMKEFVISDMHLNHGNIIMYCKRPWLQDGDVVDEPGKRPRWVSDEVKKARTEDMNRALVASWNGVVRPEDTVRHLGDFCFGAGDGKDAVYWESRLNGKIVHIKGNHDRSRQIKGMVMSAVMKAGGRELMLQHRPVERAVEVPDFCDAVLCGHVHDAWDHKWVDGVLCVNMSVEVRGYEPVPLDEVIGEVDRLLRMK